MSDQPYDSSDPKQVKKQRKDKAGDDRVANEEMKALLNSVAFRRWVWRCLDFCRFGQLSYCGENTAETNFREGMRNVGNKIFEDIKKANPKAFIEMMEEAEKKLETRKEQERGGRNDEDRDRSESDA